MHPSSLLNSTSLGPIPDKSAFKRSILVLICAQLLISSCTDVAAIAEPPDGGVSEPAQPRAEECGILQAAAAQMPPRDPYLVAVLSGCPGPYLERGPSDRQALQIAQRAAETPVPNEVRDRGLGHERLFSFLLLRGVPFDVAMELTDSPLYAQAARGFS